MLADACGQPLRVALTLGQTHDLAAARALTEALPCAAALLADRACDRNWLRARLERAWLAACVPPKRRKIATRYDRSAHTYLSAVHIAATVIFRLGQ